MNPSDSGLLKLVIADSNTGRGGKAGRGKNVRASIQVREPDGRKGYFLKKQFRYLVLEPGSKAKAMALAKKFVLDLETATCWLCGARLKRIQQDPNDAEVWLGWCGNCGKEVSVCFDSE